MKINKGLVKFVIEYVVSRQELSEAAILYQTLPNTKHLLRYNDKHIASKAAKAAVLEFLEGDDGELVSQIAQLNETTYDLLKTLTGRG